MSLRGVHLIFIFASIFLIGFFGYWAYNQYTENQLVGYFLTAIISFVLAIGLGIYGVQFAKKVKP